MKGLQQLPRSSCRRRGSRSGGIDSDSCRIRYCFDASKFRNMITPVAEARSRLRSLSLAFARSLSPPLSSLTGERRRRCQGRVLPINRTNALRVLRPDDLLPTARAPPETPGPGTVCTGSRVQTRSPGDSRIWFAIRVCATRIRRLRFPSVSHPEARTAVNIFGWGHLQVSGVGPLLRRFAQQKQSWVHFLVLGHQHPHAFREPATPAAKTSGLFSGRLQTPTRQEARTPPTARHAREERGRGRGVPGGA